MEEKIDGYKKICRYCNRVFTSTNLSQLSFNFTVHEITCANNPKNKKEDNKNDR